MIFGRDRKASSRRSATAKLFYNRSGSSTCSTKIQKNQTRKRTNKRTTKAKRKRCPPQKKKKLLKRPEILFHLERGFGNAVRNDAKHVDHALGVVQVGLDHPGWPGGQGWRNYQAVGCGTRSSAQRGSTRSHERARRHEQPVNHNQRHKPLAHFRKIPRLNVVITRF